MELGLEFGSLVGLDHFDLEWQFRGLSTETTLQGSPCSRPHTRRNPCRSKGFNGCLSGGAEGIRTPDPLTASQVLCQAELQPPEDAGVYQTSVLADTSENSIRGASAHNRSRS